MKLYMTKLLSLFISGIFLWAGLSYPLAPSYAETQAAASAGTTAVSTAAQDSLLQKASAIKGYTDYTGEEYQKVTLHGDSISFDGTGAEVSGTSFVISKPGIYVFSGTLKNGSIIVDSAEEENIRLVFNSVSISCGNGAPLYVKECGKNVVLSLVPGTENALTDGISYTAYGASEAPTAALFSKDDLRINGTGKLTVNAAMNDGITGKDDLAITEATLVVNAKDDGIVGKDSLLIASGDLTINAGGDGIKSTEADDAEKGHVAIAGGSLNITSGNDAIQAETKLSAGNGTFLLKTGAGSEHAKTYTTSSESISAKGLKSGSSLSVYDGLYTIDSEDDSLHSNGSLLLGGGTLTLASGDDGIHADGALTISGGNTTVTKSYEGAEGAGITITGGALTITASDDGINAAGGNDQETAEQMGGSRPGQDHFSGNSNHKLTISGGDTSVNAQGDGIDVNGSAYMSGGTVIVNGPTVSGNSALDYDGVFEITGGTLLTAGPAGMAQAPSSGSTQYTIAAGIGTQAAKTTVELLDSSGKVILSFTPEKEYSHLVISSPLLKQGETYRINVAGKQAASVTLSSVITSTGTGGGMGPGQNRAPGKGGSRPEDGTKPEGGFMPEGQKQ